MAQLESLGILGIEGVHYYVRDLERSRRFYCELMDLAEVAESSPELTEKGKQRSLAFQAESLVVLCSTPVGEGGRAWRYLRRHPDGIGSVAFRVKNADRAFQLLEARGGTPLSEVQRYEQDGGWVKSFSIVTPFGDTTFRFTERHNYDGVFPGMQSRPGVTARNQWGFTHIDHVTSNFITLAPALLWMEHVLGWQRYWGVEFHTKDVAKFEMRDGSGLRSTVMWDPDSGVKFANNEPFRPNFQTSQINVFVEDNRGPGVQHVALGVKDIIQTVRGLRQKGVEFLRTPGTYYDMLPERLEKLEVGKLDEDIKTLRELEILVDGNGKHSYLLQIFMKDSAGLYASADAGPFFYEVIQRKGDTRFGEGNFRALFESIERQQQNEGRV